MMILEKYAVLFVLIGAALVRCNVIGSTEVPEPQHEDNEEVPNPDLDLEKSHSSITPKIRKVTKLLHHIYNDKVSVKIKTVQTPPTNTTARRFINDNGAVNISFENYKRLSNMDLLSFLNKTIPTVKVYLKPEHSRHTKSGLRTDRTFPTQTTKHYYFDYKPKKDELARMNSEDMQWEKENVIRNEADNIRTTGKFLAALATTALKLEEEAIDNYETDDDSKINQDDDLDVNKLADTILPEKVHWGLTTPHHRRVGSTMPPEVQEFLRKKAKEHGYRPSSRAMQKPNQEETSPRYLAGANPKVLQYVTANDEMICPTGRTPKSIDVMLQKISETMIDISNLARRLYLDERKLSKSGAASRHCSFLIFQVFFLQIVLFLLR